MGIRPLGRREKSRQGSRRETWRRLICASCLIAIGHYESIAHAEPNACIAAADQGQQLRDEGKYRDARAAFVTCGRDACPTVIAKSCMQWLRELDAGMPSIVVAVRDERGNDLANARVALDGRTLTERLDGLPLAIDPGEHVVRVEREGSIAAETHVVVRAGEKGRAVLVTLRSIASSAPLPSGPAREETNHEDARQDDGRQGDAGANDAHTSFFTARNVTVLSLAAAGVLAVGGAIYFGAQSRDQADVAAGYRAANGKSACVASSSAMCGAWSDAVDAQNRDATINRALFVTAGVLSAAAIGTWLIWPSASKAHAATFVPKVAPGYAGLDVSGAF